MHFIRLKSDRPGQPVHQAENLRVFWLTFPVLSAYLVLVAFASAAIPLGSAFLKFDWLGAILFSAYAGLAIFASRSPFPRQSLLYVVFFIGMMVWNGLYSSAFADNGFDQAAYLKAFLQFLLAFVVHLGIVAERIDFRTLNRLLRLWVGIACAACLLAILQAITGKLLVEGLFFIPYYEGAKIATKVVAGIMATPAWFSEASWLGAFLVVPAVYSFSKLLRPGSFAESRRAAALQFGLISIGLILCYSMTAIISVAVGILAAAMAGRINVRRTLTWISVLTVLAACASNVPAVSLQVVRFSELINGLSDLNAVSMDSGGLTSLYVRSAGYLLGIRLFSSSPVFGIGLGQSPDHLHSGLLTLLAEQGIVGALIYYGLPIAIIFKLQRLLIAGEFGVAQQTMARLLIACLCADYFNGFITHPPFHLQRWVLVSLAVSWLFCLRTTRYGTQRQTTVNSDFQTT